MWQVENQTPFCAERAWVRDRNGAEVWIVAVKATYDILPDGSTDIAQDQPPVLYVPEYHGEPGRSSIRYEADLVLAKKTTDVIVVGNAHAPGGAPVTQLDAGFRVGPVQKLVRVYGDRTWVKGRPSAPQPFATMPLVYERAFGGADAESPQPERDWDWRNPVGCGFAVAKEHLQQARVPNVELSGAGIDTWEDRPGPAGLGAIGAHWQPRAAYAGTYDDAWMARRQPLLPEDFNDAFFQCAPPDQQAPAFLKGGEPVVMLNLSPRGRLQCHLPKIYLGFTTHFTDGAESIHDNRSLHTVILEPEYPRLSLVWHSALPCHARVQKLLHTVVTLKTAIRPRQPLSRADLEVIDDEQ